MIRLTQLSVRYSALLRLHSGAAGLRTNFGSFGLPALTLACLEDKMFVQALAVCEDARQARSEIAQHVLALCGPQMLVSFNR